MASDVKQEQNVSQNPRIERDRQLIRDARAKGRLPMLGAFVRLSGPGWLQSAITLGGGSLASSLYLGVLGGFMFMWLQPVAMIAGIIMLSAIAYVTLSTGKRPLRAINEHINPVLGWGWLLASMTANLVWSMPQFALAEAALRQNLLPGVVGEGAMPWLWGGDGLPDFWGKVIVGVFILVVALTASMLYTTGGRGMKAFEIVVKCLVGTTVLCFIGVVARLTIAGQLPWSEIFGGFVPNLQLLFTPTNDLMPLIDNVAEEYRDFWKTLIVDQQRDVMISAAATAVGINMTFLFPYSMLRKGWDRDFRGLAIFDLSTGLFFPFLLATSCVVIASASQFHAQPGIGLMGEQDDVGQSIVPAANLVGSYEGLLKDRLREELGSEAMDALSGEEIEARIEALDEADRYMAAVLARRDAFNLSDSLSPLVGRQFSHYVFGIGVLGMAMGAATMLMLINGLCLCELLNRPAMGWTQRVGSAMVCVGILGPFFWTDARMWLAVPTSVFAMTLLPFAYFSFYLLMNQRTLLGNDMPRGLKRLWWNTIMAIAAGLAAFASLWSIWSMRWFGIQMRWYGIGVVASLLLLMAVVHVVRKANRAA